MGGGSAEKWSALNGDATRGSKPSLSVSHNKLCLPRSGSLPGSSPSSEGNKTLWYSEQDTKVQSLKNKTKQKGQGGKEGGTGSLNVLVHMEFDFWKRSV